MSIHGSGASRGKSSICCVQRTATRLAVLGELHIEHNYIRALSHHIIHVPKILTLETPGQQRLGFETVVHQIHHLHSLPPTPLSTSPPPPGGVYASTNTQTPPHPLPNNPLKLIPPIPPHLRRLNIRRALIIRFRQHTHHTNQNLLHTLYRRPPLAGFFIVVRIIAWGV